MGYSKRFEQLVLMIALQCCHLRCMEKDQVIKIDEFIADTLWLRAYPNKKGRL
jgi:hypothetical protein